MLERKRLIEELDAYFGVFVDKFEVVLLSGSVDDKGCFESFTGAALP